MSEPESGRANGGKWERNFEGLRMLFNIESRNATSVFDALKVQLWPDDDMITYQLRLYPAKLQVRMGFA